MPKLEAVVFDVDGTLIDTSEFIYAAYEYVLATHQLPKRARAEIASQIGKKIEDCYAFLAPEAEALKLIATHNNFQAENLALIRPFSQVSTVLEAVRNSGLKIALWTGRAHAVRESLAVAGLNPDEFDCIIDASMSTRGKPHPEGLLKVLDVVQVEPSRTIMVGDSSLDVQAGRRAAVMATVGLTHGFGTAEELRSSGADYVIDSLAELPGTLKAIEQN